MRHPTRAEIDKFNDLLGLIERADCQDWEIECSDPDRIEEFIDCYSAHANSAAEKFTLMAPYSRGLRGISRIEPSIKRDVVENQRASFK